MSMLNESFVTHYFEVVDSRDIDALLTFYDEKAVFTFANNEPAQGKSAIRSVLEAFYQIIASMRHERRGIWLSDRSAVFEALVHFEGNSPSQTVSVPAISILRVDDAGKIVDFRFVMDPAPVYAFNSGTS